VIFAVVAVACLCVLMYLRTTGVARLRSRWLREEGKVQQSKLEMAYALAFGVGTLLALLGILLNEWPLRVLGIVIFCCSLPIMIAQMIIRRRYVRESVEK
jgi:Flp pilus assembly protein TadB